MRGFLAKHLGVFDPDDIRILVGAFDKAWEAVQASGEVFDSKARVDTARAILAKHLGAARRYRWMSSTPPAASMSARLLSLGSSRSFYRRPGQAAGKAH